tara:strand:+ start:2429 stop:3250 length:822 start_codon:yes stop_codon:yes gene_type:complete
MNTDANESVNEEVIMPSTRSDDVNEETLDTQSNSAPSVEPEDNQDKKSRDFQSRYNLVTKKAYTEERRAIEAEEKLAQLQAQFSTQTPAIQPAQDIQAPVLPEDIYDEDAMRKYHTDSAAYTNTVAQSAAKNQFESQQQASAQQAQQVQHQATVETYAKNATRDGVNLDKLALAEQTLKQNGLSDQLGQYLINDQNGAKLVEYLNDNPAEMHEILSLDPVSAGIRIATEIKPKALSQTRKVSGAPDPIPEVQGGGGYVAVDDFDKKYPGAEII